MTLLAGITYAQKLTIIILCIVVIAFTLLNAFLVVDLHRRNSKLNKKLPPPEESPSLPENKDNPPKNKGG